MTNDIVARLRLYAQMQRETKSSVLGLLLAEAADEIERLHRDYSCICNEMRRMKDERDEARRLAETISRDVSMLSTRPANIIKFGDLVNLINEWGDDARKILEHVSDTDKLEADHNNNHFRSNYK